MPRFKIRIATSTAAAALLGASLLAAPIGASAQQSTQPMTPQATPSQAAPATPPMAAPAPARADKAPRSDKVETHIKSLHAQLKITPDEEDQWSAVADAMRDNAHAIDQLVQDRTKQLGHMTAVDDMKSYQAITQAHADEMQKLVPAFEALYDKMPDAQKKRADTVFNQRTAARQAAAPKKG